MSPVNASTGGLPTRSYPSGATPPMLRTQPEGCGAGSGPEGGMTAVVEGGAGLGTVRRGAAMLEDTVGEEAAPQEQG